MNAAFSDSAVERSWLLEWVAELADGRTLRVQANSAVGLLGAHFKKTAPLEWIRSGRLQADTETRPALLPSSASKNPFKKGLSGFLCGTSNPCRVGQEQQR
ncbi:MAG: hypothetical protein CMN89_10530 [Sutterellaceae bacterium]|nr:hypothetical protein [Sutterellaceae bacterium]MBT84895.1 hypothetical protein [Sutterellaceae bacterium]PZO12989.1 MAG: hypothetical protein DCE87_13865 [Betaproteobacteria bacterium]HAV73798.1 hypothetical protein [Limnobacter sp.]